MPYVIIIQLAQLVGRANSSSAGRSVVQRLIPPDPDPTRGHGVGKANNRMGGGERNNDETADRGLASRANICAIIFWRSRRKKEKGVIEIQRNLAGNTVEKFGSRASKVGAERDALGPESGRMI